MTVSLGGVFAGAMLVALPQVAQAAPGDECAAMPSQAEEIACLRRALAESQGRAAPAQAVPAQPAPVEHRAAERTAPAPAPVAQPQQSAANLGSEQLPGSRERFEARDRDPQLQAVVVSSIQDREGLFTLELDNGQKWKQVERPAIQIVMSKDNSYAVEIKKSGFGGYRMFFPDMNRTIVVRRVM